MLTELLPYLFDSWTLRNVPPTDACTICRSVFPDRPGAGGKLLGSVSCGPDAHEPTHCETVAAPWVVVVSSASSSIGEQATSTAHVASNTPATQALLKRSKNLFCTFASPGRSIDRLWIPARWGSDRLLSRKVLPAHVPIDSHEADFDCPGRLSAGRL